jgi:hypothetical protein
MDFTRLLASQIVRTAANRNPESLTGNTFLAPKKNKSSTSSKFSPMMNDARCNFSTQKILRRKIFALRYFPRRQQPDRSPLSQPSGGL